MIHDFADRETQALWEGRRCRLPSNIQRRAFIKLRILDAAKDINDLRFPPGNHLEALSGNRHGQHSIRINQQWRICFEWHDGASKVEIVDYH